MNGNDSEAVGDSTGKHKKSRFLDAFYRLADTTLECRVSGAETVIKELVKSSEESDSSDKLQYTIERLIKGLPSTRKCARVGFAVTLVEVLRAFPGATAEEVQACILKYLPEDTKEDKNHVILARGLTLAALVRSGKAVEAAGSVAKEVLELGTRHGHLQLMACDIFKELLNQGAPPHQPSPPLRPAHTEPAVVAPAPKAAVAQATPPTPKQRPETPESSGLKASPHQARPKIRTNSRHVRASSASEEVNEKKFKKKVWPELQEMLSCGWEDCTPLKLYVLVQAASRFPSLVDGAFLQENWGCDSILDKANYAHIVQILQKSTVVHPNVHPVCTLILQAVASTKGFKKFWRSLMDECLLTSRRDEHVFLAVQLVKWCLPQLTTTDKAQFLVELAKKSEDAQIQVAILGFFVQP
ncbi:hypothetical protein HPB51_003279 [Rhipicephalus microplus]|uniref:Uncharacterized protein n=1 Tax=Rhipicephalus microplus TaxID=6941 RepID=A0A9J6EW94_RHIMP|nr:hypothetical protein HPB51_003279 [Rhipicephalus microplus]